MKKLLFIFFLSSIYSSIDAQTDSLKSTGTVPTKPQLTRSIKKQVIKPRVSDTIKKTNILQADTTIVKIPDTAKAVVPDTLKILIKPQLVKEPIDTFYRKLLNNPYLKKTGRPIYLIINERERQSKDEPFYLLAGLLLFLAFIRLAFSSYFTNIFRLFFQPVFRQKQTREQLLQNSFPSFLMNFFFILSVGSYISFLIINYQLTHLNFWEIFFYSTSSLLVVYTSKFVLLTFAGWVFNAKEATGTYLFAVYLINKIMGVLLIPFILIISFSKAPIIDISITVSFLLIGLLFIYRYFVSFAPVRREVKVNAMHFLFYIFAFEITPLLLIYKTLVLYFNKSL